MSTVAALAVLLFIPCALLRAGTPSALRDITVAAGGARATITILVSSKVETVVLAAKANGLAQIRMRPMTATPQALASGLPHAGVRAIRAWIERTDVLITNITFTRRVTGMRVMARTGDHVVVEATLGDAVGSATTPTTPASGTGRQASQRDTTRTPRNRPWALPVIVIDAGHGGKDPGAIGVGGIREKDVTLAVARYLRDELKRRAPTARIVMTRSGDSFVELYRRGQIANERGGRLFLSIHCNSMPTIPSIASGFESYILSPNHSDDAARVAAAENRVVQLEADNGRYGGTTTEEAMLASLAQSAYGRYSEQLASAITTAMHGSTGIPDRGIHQAGFYVLIGASMPAVLVEIGYLSSEHDARILGSDRGRRRIATALARAVVAYERIMSAE